MAVKTTQQMPKRLLIVLQLPPPVHGASLMNAHLLDALGQSALEWEHLAVNEVQQLGGVGRFGIKKVLSSCSVLSQMVHKRRHYSHFMLTLSTKGYALIRDYLMIVWAKVLRKRIVLLLRGKGYSRKKGIQARMVCRMFRGSSVIQHTELLFSDIRHLPHKKVYFLANGLPDQSPCTGTEPLDRHPGEPVQIIFLSNLLESKGLFVLVEALDRLAQKGLVFVCHFIGAWTSENSMLRLKRLVRERKLEQFVGEIGPRYGDDKFAFLSRMDLMVFPTLNEAFGNVVLEAMMCSKPVVASREGSLPKIVVDGETGLLVETGLVEPLAGAMEILIRDKNLRQRMGQNGRRRYLEQFTMEHYSRRALDIFSEILSS